MQKSWLIWIEIILFYVGILVFTFFISGEKSSNLIALSAISLSTVVMAYRLKSPRDLVDMFGFTKLDKGAWIYIGISILFGLLFGMFYRQYLKLGTIPSYLVSFAIMASLIGGVEELVFRGFIQTKLRKINIYMAIGFAAVSHTGYKVMVFWSLNAGMEINFTALIFWTILVGLLIGVIREVSKSVVFAIIAHAVFDIIVYGDNIVAPWWIWG